MLIESVLLPTRRLIEFVKAGSAKMRPYLLQQKAISLWENELLSNEQMQLKKEQRKCHGEILKEIDFLTLSLYCEHQKALCHQRQKTTDNKYI